MMRDDTRGLVHVTHGFGPVFDERSRTLILGSFPSVKSREAAFFYGNPQNRFWRVLAALLDEPELVESPESWMSPADIDRRRCILLAHGVALWDVIESCDIVGSSDASIRNVEPVDIDRILAAAHIERVITNGGTATRLYHRYLEQKTGIAPVALPSTSPANASWSLARLVEEWGSKSGLGV